MPWGGTRNPLAPHWWAPSAPPSRDQYRARSVTSTNGFVRVRISLKRMNYKNLSGRPHHLYHFILRWLSQSLPEKLPPPRLWLCLPSCDEQDRLRWLPELVLGIDIVAVNSSPEFRTNLARLVRRLQGHVHPDRHSGDEFLSR